MNTYKEETLVEEIPSEEEDNETGVPLYKIISYPADFQLEGLVQRWQREEIIIPPSQRGWVWTHKQASKLIESFLLGLPVPSIFLYKEPKTQKNLVIDGQQRLRTIKGFFEGKLPDGSDFFLKGVDPKWEGKYYKDLDDPDRIRLRDYVLRVVIVEQLDPNDNTSIYHIFERLNTGGTGLTPQEVRNSTYHGPFNDLLVDLNEDDAWRAVFGTTHSDPRMRDVELIVRFSALFENADSYAKPMKQYLNNFMGRHQWDQHPDQFKTVFLKTVKRVHKALGPKPFHIKRGINAAVFDSVMLAFAKSNAVPEDILSRFTKLQENPSYQNSISAGTTDVDTLKNRINLASEILFG